MILERILRTTRIVTREGMPSEAFLRWIEQQLLPYQSGAVLYSGAPGASETAWQGGDDRVITLFSMHNPTISAGEVTLMIGSYSETFIVRPEETRTGAFGCVIRAGEAAIVSGTGDVFVTLSGRPV